MITDVQARLLHHTSSAKPYVAFHLGTQKVTRPTLTYLVLQMSLQDCNDLEKDSLPHERSRNSRVKP